MELVPIEQVTPEHFEMTFNTNARGTLFTVKKALPLLSCEDSSYMIGNDIFASGGLSRV